MICRKISLVALSGLTAALSLSAMAQDTTTSSTTTSTTMDSSAMMAGGASSSAAMPMSMEPMQVSGTVQRYYTDRSGYVTAMDVQTAEGSRMVRFSPGMAQRVYTTYPVGGQISGTIQPSMSMGRARYDLVAVGDQMPAAGMMKPDMTSDIQTLKADPFIQAGSGLVQFSGKLKSVVTDDRGEVLALVISGAPKKDMAAPAAMDASASMATGTMDGTTPTVVGGMMAEETTLVRVPRELRHPGGAKMAGSDRVSPLFRGAEVEVVGYNEAPRYGVVSSYGERVAATALVINGRAVGALGLPLVNTDRKNTLLSFNIGGGKSQEEMNALDMGYSTYGMMSSPTDAGGDMGGGGMTSSTTTTGS